MRHDLKAIEPATKEQMKEINKLLKLNDELIKLFFELSKES